MKEQVGEVEWETNLSTSSKYTGLGAAKGPLLVGRFAPSGLGSLCDLLAAELMIGFWFGIGVILAVKMVQSLQCCIEELISRK